MARNYTIRKCDRCCPDGGAICDRTFDDDQRPAWECRNCGLEMPRREPARRTESTPLSRRQLRAITEIQLYQLDGRNHEVKRLQVKNCGSFASVVCEVGGVGDEGTLAAILCRYRGHFFVGPRGRIRVADHQPTADQRRYPLIYGWRN